MAPLTKPTLAQVIDRFISSRLASLHTSMPAIVQSYDKETQTVEVQPAIKNVYTNEDEEEQVESLPLLVDVPVVFPRAGGFFVSFPIVKGDSVLVVFGERSMDQWQGTGKESDPGDLRRFSLSDAVAIPGVFPSTAPLKDAHGENMVMGKDEGAQIHLKPNGEVHLAEEDASDFVALAAKVKASIDALQVAHDLHTHLTTATVGPSAVPGVLAPTTTLVGAQPSTAATKVKAT